MVDWASFIYLYFLELGSWISFWFSWIFEELWLVWCSDAPPYNLHTYLQFVPFDLLINKNESGTINSDLPICKKRLIFNLVAFCFFVATLLQVVADVSVDLLLVIILNQMNLVSIFNPNRAGLLNTKRCQKHQKYNFSSERAESAPCHL